MYHGWTPIGFDLGPRIIPSIRLRNAVWTGFLPEDLQLEDAGPRRTQWIDQIRQRLIHSRSVRYFIFQLEAAPDTGRLHLQGYLQLTSQATITGLKKIMKVSGFHFEKAHGTAQENKDYCSKEESRVEGPWEWGNCKMEKTKKETLQTIDLVRDLVSGKSTVHLAMTYPEKWLRYNKALGVLRDEFLAVPRNWMTKVFWYWGKTGTGKSRMAHLLTKGKAFVAPDNSGKWFDGYSGQKDVIFDDFSPDDCLSRGLFLRLFDRYPMRVPVKGGFVNWAPKRVFITSNCEPSTLYANDAAVYRRITEQFRF